MAGVALSVRAVSKRYGRVGLAARLLGKKRVQVQALREVSFEVREGETFGLLGPNGAGKTTLLKIVSSLIVPDTGSVAVGGHDVHQDETAARRLLGLVTCDERSFYWRLTGRQNLGFFATLYGLHGRARRSRVEELLAAVGLEHAADRRYDGYSSGMKQKLAIARGLLSDPKLVLYDEPTRSLDPLSAQNVRRWILSRRAYAPSQTHVIATNQLDEAEQLCDRVVIVNRGAVIAQGTIAEIRERWRRGRYDSHVVTYRGGPAAASLAAAPERGLLAVRAAAAEDGATALSLHTAAGSTALSEVLHAILREGGDVMRCETHEVPFDEVFCSLVLGDPPEAAAKGV